MDKEQLKNNITQEFIYCPWCKMRVSRRDYYCSYCASRLRKESFFHVCRRGIYKNLPKGIRNRFSGLLNKALVIRDRKLCCGSLVYDESRDGVTDDITLLRIKGIIHGE